MIERPKRKPHSSGEDEKKREGSLKRELAEARSLSGSPRSAFRDLWRNIDYRRLWIGQSISALGDWLAVFALLVLVYDRSHSVGAVAGLLALQVIPAAFSGVVSTWISDLWDRRQIMIACDLIRGFMILLVVIIDNVVFIYIIIFFLQFFTVAFQACRDASLPNMLKDPGHLTMANSMILGTTYGSIPVAAALFSVLVVAQSPILGPLKNIGFFDSHPYAFSFLGDAASFFFSGYMIFLIKERTAFRAKAKEIQPQGPLGATRAGFRSSMGFVFRDPFARTIMAAISFGALGGGALFAVGIVYVRQVLQGTSFEFGFLMALFGIGMLSGIVGLQFISQMKAKWLLFKTALLLAGGTLIWMAVLTVVYLAYIAAFVFGAAFAVLFITGVTMVQENISDENRGKAFAAFYSLSRIFLLFGAAMAAGIAAAIKDFTINLYVYHIHVFGVTISMFIAGVLLASVAFLPIRESIREHEDMRGKPVEDKGGA
jgi:dTMP kinase